MDISLSETVFFDTPRLIASTINEDKLTFFPKQKSLALNIAMTSDDENLSPAVDLKNATFNMEETRLTIQWELKIMQLIIGRINY